MGTKICANCEQTIGNLESVFFYEGHAVCEKCSNILEDGAQATESFDSNIATGIPLEQAAAPVHQTDDGFTQRVRYGGIGRLFYFLATFGVGFIFGLMVPSSIESDSSAWMTLIIINIIFAVFRLHNIGISGWWSVLTLVPIAGFFVIIACLALPEGYKDTRKLDLAGKIIIGTLIGLVALFILIVVIAEIGS